MIFVLLSSLYVIIWKEEHRDVLAFTCTIAKSAKHLGAILKCQRLQTTERQTRRPQALVLAGEYLIDVFGFMIVSEFTFTLFLSFLSFLLFLCCQAVFCAQEVLRIWQRSRRPESDPPTRQRNRKWAACPALFVFPHWLGPLLSLPIVAGTDWWGAAAGSSQNGGKKI